MKISDENIARLKDIVRTGIQIHREMDDLRGGLKDTVADLAKQMEVKPALINKLIKDEVSNKTNERKEDEDIMEELRRIVGL